MLPTNTSRMAIGMNKNEVEMNIIPNKGAVWGIVKDKNSDAQGSKRRTYSIFVKREQYFTQIMGLVNIYFFSTILNPSQISIGINRDTGAVKKP